MPPLVNVALPAIQAYKPNSNIIQALYPVCANNIIFIQIITTTQYSNIAHNKWHKKHNTNRTPQQTRQVIESTISKRLSNNKQPIQQAKQQHIPHTKTTSKTTYDQQFMQNQVLTTKRTSHKRPYTKALKLLKLTNNHANLHPSQPLTAPRYARNPEVGLTGSSTNLMFQHHHQSNYPASNATHKNTVSYETHLSKLSNSLKLLTNQYTSRTRKVIQVQTPSRLHKSTTLIFGKPKTLVAATTTTREQIPRNYTHKYTSRNNQHHNIARIMPTKQLAHPTRRHRPDRIIVCGKLTLTLNPKTASLNPRNTTKPKSTVNISYTRPKHTNNILMFNPTPTQQTMKSKQTGTKNCTHNHKHHQLHFKTNHHHKPTSSSNLKPKLLKGFIETLQQIANHHLNTPQFLPRFSIKHATHPHKRSITTHKRDQNYLHLKYTVYSNPEPCPPATKIRKTSKLRQIPGVTTNTHPPRTQISTTHKRHSVKALPQKRNTHIIST
eukprot:gene3301-2283_t